MKGCWEVCTGPGKPLQSLKWTACWTHTSLSSLTRVFSIAARYYWPLRSLTSRLGSKQIDFRKRIPFCFCGAILQYCGFELCSLDLRMVQSCPGAGGLRGGGQGEGSIFCPQPHPSLQPQELCSDLFHVLGFPISFLLDERQCGFKKKF